jgi:hypothetical protein
MESGNTQEQEVVLEPYRTQIDKLLKKTTFQYFENNKPYSFDYQYKSEFDEITNTLKKELEQKKILLSSSISNKLPIFLPSETSRISFFSYKSKSVRAINIDELESILIKQAKKRCRESEFTPSEIDKRVKNDLKIFEAYHNEHNFKDYRRDISTSTIQFNAYDEDDNLLLEKSFVRGGLIFDMQPEEFEEKISVSYPRYRKQRSDKKDDYLPLKLIKIRGIKTDSKSNT